MIDTAVPEAEGIACLSGSLELRVRHTRSYPHSTVCSRGYNVRRG